MEWNIFWEILGEININMKEGPQVTKQINSMVTPMISILAIIRKLLNGLDFPMDELNGYGIDDDMDTFLDGVMRIFGQDLNPAV